MRWGGMKGGSGGGGGEGRRKDREHSEIVACTAWRGGGGWIWCLVCFTVVNFAGGNSIAFGSALQREADSQPISKLVRQAVSQKVSRASR